MAQEQTLYNTHTKELLEGYLDPAQTNSSGHGIDDFMDKMVLRFKNEHEISLYFEIVDQLSRVLTLKGHKVLLEKEHYQDMLKTFVNVNRDFLLFLCKDEAYGEIKRVQELAGETTQSADDGQARFENATEAAWQQAQGAGFDANHSQEVIHK